ncbi:hypothetical protein BDU57DRAFT_103845 [Ampelomyces quisqualis]|uniref:Uncharacterized protein n=1 Tax=Ampelomyces quisqualis TaxID=50730 RepID=A0A6A5Q9A2_AMPQU|nr:hypothetical protein BDU57DRAFT_103845 [Ampelomyces quisqualis]
MSFLTFLTFVSALSNVAQANEDEDVSYALEVLNELPAELASPYCSSYAGGGAVKTWTVTAAPYTITKTLDPTPCGKPGGYTAAPWGKSDEGYPATKLGGFDYPAPSYEDSEDYHPAPSEEYYPDVTEAPYPGDGNYPGEGGEPGEEPDVFVTSTTTLTYTLTSTRTSTIYPGSTDALVVDPTGFMWPEPTDVYIDPTNSDPTYANPTDALYLNPVAESTDDIYVDPIYTDPTDDIYVDPVYADPADDVYSDPTFVPLKRSAKFLFSRAQWCDDIGRPCRLMVYTDAEISDACGKYLGDAGGYKADAVTVTETAYGETTTVTITPDACVTGDYAEYTGAPEYGTESKPEHGYEGEEETGAPWGEEGASYGGESAPHGEEGVSHGEGKPSEGDYESHEGGEHGGLPAEGKPEHGEEEPKPKPKMCKVKSWKK